MSHAKDKNYWKHVVAEIEKASAARIRRDFIKDNDYAMTLPTKLKRRVAKIIHYDYDDYDPTVYGADLDVRAIQREMEEIAESDSTEIIEDVVKPKKIDFNESSCSSIERLEHEFVGFDLKLEKPLKQTLKAKKKVNWCSSFLCKGRKERVKWDSKIYKMDTNMFEKTLDERAEALVEAAAERFSEWVNSLGTNSQTSITKEKLISLFSIEGDRCLLASIHTEPKEINAIAKTIADKWQIPEMALELKYENYIKNRFKKIPKKVIKVAFGRTVPYCMRPWVPTVVDDRIKTVYPEEILTGQMLFKGIKHLRSTKALVDFYRSHPQFPKPRYMEHQGMFKMVAQSTMQIDEPLYDKLKLNY